VRLQVGYWRRFVPELRELRERIAGSPSEISMLMAVQWDGEPPSAEFRDPRSSGGILVDMGVHEFDMLRWLTGQELGAIAGFASNVAWRAPVANDPETVNLVVELSGGTTAVISLARRHPPGDLCRVEVLGGDTAEAITFVRPGDGDAGMAAALQAQAEALAGHATGEPALVEDAVEALEAATRASEQLGLGDAVAAR
jgi:myo-inositol 2-dehydrogenase/D-chiro-inositol 1-dehydrogenase